MKVTKILLIGAFCDADSIFVKTYNDRSKNLSNRILSQQAQLTKPNGDAKCPCISYDKKNKLSPKTNLSEYLGQNIELAYYGVNCARHDMNSTKCSYLKNCDITSSNNDDCTRDGCQLPWCYVDVDNCDLVSSKSTLYKNAHYSPATCGFIDTKLNPYDTSRLQGQTFNAALLSNTGGWAGAYNPEGHFAMNDLWYGPLVDFMIHATAVGDFNFNYTRPPEWLQNYAQDYFDSNSMFDYCVYAISLGFLDICNAAFTLTPERTEITPFFKISNRQVHLFIKAAPVVPIWQEFVENLPKIFLPFDTWAWCAIIAYLMILGLIMLIFEYNAPGSVYPREVACYYKRDDDKPVIEMRNVPKANYAIRSMYRSLLAFCEQSFGQNVYTVEGKILLLAISFFIMMVIALYTANIAAILTTNIQKSRINTIQDAINQGYNFCAHRNIVPRMVELYGMDEKLFVPDPIELGGDGKPGFVCPNCMPRSRVFEFMRASHNNRSLYCNAAIGYRGDLDVFHNLGEFCDILRVGNLLHQSGVGIPMSTASFPALSSLFHKILNDNYLTKHAKRPESICTSNADSETNSLTILQLSGLWSICTVIVLFALVFKVMRSMYRNFNPGRKRDLQRFDQWGEPSSYDIIIDGHVYREDDHNFRKSMVSLIDEGDRYDTKNESSNDMPVNYFSSETRKRAVAPKGE